MNYILGFDIGGTSTKLCVIKENDVNIDGISKIPIFYEKKINYPENFNLETFKNQFVIEVEHIRDSIIEKNSIISKIGIAFPGVLSNNFTALSATNLKFFEGINIKELFAEITEIELSQIFIDNDANIAGYCEYLQIKNSNSNFSLNNENLNNNKTINPNNENFVFITLGTGIGCAIFINGKLYRGVNGGAGEFGHSLFNLQNIDELFDFSNSNYTVDFIKSFTLDNNTIEDLVGSKNFINLINKYHLNSNTPNQTAIYLEFSDFVRGVLNNDVNSLKVLEIYSLLLGLSLSSLHNILDINHLIIGGGGSIMYEFITPTLRKIFDIRLLPHIKNNFVISQSQLGNLSGALGAVLFTQK